MIAKFAVLTALAVVSAAARSKRPAALDPGPLQQLKCRTAPKETAFLARSYGDQDVVELQCQVTGGLTTGRTAEWLRTGDDCYVPAYYVNIDDVSRELLPDCTAIDSARPCILPNRSGFDLLERVEGFLDRPRGDIIAGLPYVGFGHQCMTAKCDMEPDFVASFPMSRNQASVVLWHDVRNATKCLSQMLKVGGPPRAASSVVLTDNMWSALVSWTFSVGCDLAAQSQLIKRLRHGESPMVVAATELPKWTVIHGKPVSDLASRRDAELSLFRTQSSRMA
ncbi:hypothetical protein IWW38_002476, partial [Coemansia aciculifera]